MFFDVEEEVECGDLGEVEDGVGGEDFVVEVDEVEADDEVGVAEFADELFGFLFGVDVVGVVEGVVGGGDGEFHFVDVVPASDVVGAVLGFEVEVDDVFIFFIHRFRRLAHCFFC